VTDTYTTEQFDHAAELILNGFTREGAAFHALGEDWGHPHLEALVAALPPDQFDGR
jgi:hypothetical protein